MSATSTISRAIECRTSGALRPAFRVLVIALLVLVAGEVFLSSRQESQVSDEADHLYAGYQYWKHGDFGRNPEHPPLAKFVAAAALLPLHLTEPDDPSERFKYRDFHNGEEFLYHGDADAMLARGRGILLLFTLALALGVFAAGREMFGPEAGLLAMGLFCLEPVLLGNAGLILTDMALSCAMFVSVYAFYRYVKRPGWGRLAVCAVAVGLTLVAKQSGVFVLPILGGVAVAELIIRARWVRGDGVSVRREAVALLAALGIIAVVGFAVLWAFYGFRYAARPGGLTMTPTLKIYTAAVPNRGEAAAIGFCARHHLLPEAYLYGWADILQVPGQRNSYILGRLYTGEWRLGFPVMIVMKTTITLLGLLLLVPLSGVWRRRREFLLLAIPAAIYLLIAIASGMNAELRYILPVYPFCIVLAGAAGWEMVRRSRGWGAGVAALMVFGATSSLHAFPDYLAYSNEAFGGPSQSYRIMAGTNGDGGQGLKWVKTYLEQNHVEDCWFDYTNPFVDPAYYGIPCKRLESDSALVGSRSLGAVPSMIRGTVLISATDMAAWTWAPDALDPYRPFRHLRPDAKPGNVVLAYRGTFDVTLLSAYSHSLIAKNLASAGKMTEAIAEAQEAVKLAPDSASMQAGLGLTLMSAGRRQEGQQVNAMAMRLAKAVHPEFQGQLIQLLELPGMTGGR